MMCLGTTGTLKNIWVSPDSWLRTTDLGEQVNKVTTTTTTTTVFSLQFYFKIEGGQTIDTFALKGYLMFNLWMVWLKK